MINFLMRSTPPWGNRRIGANRRSRSNLAPRAFQEVLGSLPFRIQNLIFKLSTYNSSPVIQNNIPCLHFLPKTKMTSCPKPLVLKRVPFVFLTLRKATTFEFFHAKVNIGSINLVLIHGFWSSRVRALFADMTFTLWNRCYRTIWKTRICTTTDIVGACPRLLSAIDSLVTCVSQEDEEVDWSEKGSWTMLPLSISHQQRIYWNHDCTFLFMIYFLPYACVLSINCLAVVYFIYCPGSNHAIPTCKDRTNHTPNLANRLLLISSILTSPRDADGDSSLGFAESCN